jgi:hypothetical protein
LSALEGYWASFSPFVLSHPWTLGSSDSQPPSFRRHKLGLSFPVLFFHLSGLPLGLLLRARSEVDSGSARSVLFRSASLQHSWLAEPHFSSGPFLPAFDTQSHVHQRFRPQGLATLSTAYASASLGSLFQLPTLVGFPLQSVFPSRDRNSLSGFLPSLRFHARPHEPDAGASMTSSRDPAVPPASKPIYGLDAATALLSFLPLGHSSPGHRESTFLSRTPHILSGQES